MVSVAPEYYCLRISRLWYDLVVIDGRVINVLFVKPGRAQIGHSSLQMQKYVFDLFYVLGF